MVIRIQDPSRREELRAHFLRAGFEAVVTGESSIAVRRPDAPDDEQARREVEAQLAVWPLLHPGAPAELVAD